MAKKNNSGFLLGAIIGGAAAAAAALLMAPKAGKQTREDLMEQMDNLKEKSKTTDYTQIAKETGTKVLSKAQDIKDSAVSNIKKGSEELKNTDWESKLDSLVDDAQEIVLDVKDMSTNAVDNVKDMASDFKEGVQSTFNKNETEELVADAKEAVDEKVEEAKDSVEKNVSDIKDEMNL